MDETSADIEELSREMHTDKRDDIAANLVGRFKNFKNDLESSFDRERSGMEEYFENEKHDIMKGFMLEKEILNREHEKEKEDLVQTFVKERQKMMQSFQAQVKDIESNLKKTDRTATAKESVVNVSSEAKLSNDIQNSNASKLMIKVDGNRIITPQEFLATLEIEEKFESEKDTIVKSFRKEKERMKDKLEIDYERKIMRVKQKHEDEIKELQRDIENLKNLKYEVSSMWKQQSTKLETEFQKERMELEKHYKEEREILRRRLEERNEAKLRKQQHDYDHSISELKSELKRIKQDAVKHEHVTTDHTLQIKQGLTKQMRESFERETKIIREQNEKLCEDLKQLTTEKYKLAQSQRELEIKTENEMREKEKEVNRLKKEYEQKARKFSTQIDKLKIQLRENEKQKECLSQRADSNEANNKNIEERLILTERTVSECEDTIIGMRIENSNLSHEINLLRNEKEELLKTLEKCQESERNMKIDKARIENETNETNGRFILLEREKLQQEKLIAGLRKKLENTVSQGKETHSRYTAFENETNRLRNLLDGERKENKRLHERFKQDAELIRKKDNENQNMRTQLDNIKLEFESLKSKIESENEKILKMSSEKESLLKEVEKLKSTGILQHQRDIVTIQNQYVKEFSKRLDYVKANYEREIQDLKSTIETLKHIKTKTACCGDKKTQCIWLEDAKRRSTNCESSQISFSPSELKESSTTCNVTRSKHYDMEKTREMCSEKNVNDFISHDQLFQQNLYDSSHVQNNNSCQEWSSIADRLKQPTTNRNDGVANQNSFKHNANSSAFQSIKQNQVQNNSLEPTTHHLKNINAIESTQSIKKCPQNNSWICDQNAKTIKSWLIVPEIPQRELCYVEGSPQSSTPEQAYIDLMKRVSSAESNRDDDELRTLLKDVRNEVLQLNKMIDECTPNSTPRFSSSSSQNREIRQEKRQLPDDFGPIIFPTTTGQSEEMRRLHEENSKLQKRVTEQQDELYKHGNSCEELLQRRKTLETLVDRLQKKLRLETSRRRQLEQEKNKIREESFENFDDDSTV